MGVASHQRAWASQTQREMARVTRSSDPVMYTWDESPQQDRPMF